MYYSAKVAEYYCKDLFSKLIQLLKNISLYGIFPVVTPATSSVTTDFIKNSFRLNSTRQVS